MATAMLKPLSRLLTSRGALRHIAAQMWDPRWLTRNLSRLVQAKHADLLLDDFLRQFETKVPYDRWIAVHERLDAASLKAMRANVDTFRRRPRFSIVVPTYETAPEVLTPFLDSVLAQVYPDWELCIADDASRQPHVRATLERYAANDPRIKVTVRTTNGHIAEATNTALEMASGDFICLMDHDDTIAPNALYEFALALDADPDLDFIYSDEDKITADGQTRYEPFFKPDWSPEYLESCMYTAHFACYRTSIVRRVGGFRKEFNGAQDYDFVLRFVEHIGKAAHIPKILYHWRAIPGSTAASMDNKDYVIDAAVRALTEHIERTGRLAFVRPNRYGGCFDVRRQVEGEPKVSIVIPSAGRPSEIRGEMVDLVVNCVRSIAQTSSYRNLELIVVHNGDLRPETVEALDAYGVVYVHYTDPVFNIAAKMNLGAQAATGDYVLFLNDDTEVINPDWLEAMLSLAQRPGVGVVGAKLYFEDGTLQHVGVTFCAGLPDHIRRGFSGDDPGYFFSTVGQRNYMAVTGACMLLRRALFEEVGGFEEALAINYNDIDLCLKVWDRGLRIVYTAQAELFHFESRNRERSVAAHEQAIFLERWGERVSTDPFYSPYFAARPPNFELILC
ncbi:glycosyltransferase family 2 protein [Azospirillum argentinense]